MNNERIETLYRRMCYLVLIIASIISGYLVVTVEPMVYGDGYEYILYTEAIENHFSFDVRQEDYEEALVDYPNMEPTIEYVYNNHMSYTDNGKAYFNHFAFYSVLVLPAKNLLKMFGGNQLRAFAITNALMYVAALSGVLLLKRNWCKRFYCLLLLFFNPILLYVLWTHTEVYIYCMAVYSLIFYYNKEYKKSALAISLASMQNLAIIPIGAMIGLAYLYELFEQWKKNTCGQTLFGYYMKCWKKILGVGICYIPFFIPIIHTIINFRTISLVSDVAREKAYLFEKAWAYLFDLNLGILPYEPIVLILFLVVILKKIVKKDINALLNLVAMVGVLYIISNQRQINCGMNGIMRYNVWIIPLMIFLVVDTMFEEYTKKRRMIEIGMCGQALYLAMMFVVLGVSPYIYGPNEFAPWVEKVLDTVPSLYNPTHGIFISRETGEEEYFLEEVCVHVDSQGYLRKILVDDNTISELDEYLFLGDDSAKVLEQIEEAKIKEGYRYISVNWWTDVKMVPVVDAVDLRNGAGKNKMLGAYDVEGDLCWVMNNPIVALKNEDIQEKGIEIHYIPSNVVKELSGKQFEMDIYINGEIVRTVSADVYDGLYKIKISPDELGRSEDAVYIVEFRANSYAEVPNDERELSFLIQYVGVLE